MYTVNDVALIYRPHATKRGCDLLLNENSLVTVVSTYTNENRRDPVTVSG